MTMGPSAIGAQPPPEEMDDEWLMMQEDEESEEPFCNCSTGQGHAKQQEMDERIPPEWYWKQIAVEGYDEQNCKNEIIGNREYIQVLEDRTNRYEQEIASLREQLENCMFLVSRIENERNDALAALEARK